MRLVRNYRSTQAVADAALQALPGGAEAARMLAGRLRPRAHRLPRAPTDRAEAEFVVASLEGLLGGHSFFSIDSGRALAGAAADGLAFSDVAVLYRLDALAEPVIEALERSGIPCAAAAATSGWPTPWAGTPSTRGPSASA